MELRVFLETLIFKRLGHAWGHTFQIDLIYCVLCAFQQPELVLAKRQDVKVTVAGKKGQQGFKVKTSLDHDQFFKRERQTIGMKRFRRQKYR